MKLMKKYEEWTDGVGSLPARGAWIEMAVDCAVAAAVLVAPREGSVD